MARRRDTGEDTLLKVLGTTALVGAGGFLLYYLMSGAGSENDAPLIPNSIERHLDAVVDALNRRVGKGWVRFGISFLERALEGVLPPGTVAFVSAVHQAEQIGLQRGLSGPQKRHHAVRLVQANGRG